MLYYELLLIKIIELVLHMNSKGIWYMIIILNDAHSLFPPLFFELLNFLAILVCFLLFLCEHKMRLRELVLGFTSL